MHQVLMVPVASFVRLHPHTVVAAGAALAVVVGAGAYLLTRHRPTLDEVEARRRRRLAAEGRIIDGTLVNPGPAGAEGEPGALMYRYRVGGVTYECGQNVSALRELLPDLGSDLLGRPVQVRYDRDNPADSIVIAEEWNGLWEQRRRRGEGE